MMKRGCGHLARLVLMKPSSPFALFGVTYVVILCFVSEIFVNKRAMVEQFFALALNGTNFNKHEGK